MARCRGGENGGMLAKGLGANFFWRPVVLGLLVASLLLGGCYQVPQEIIPVTLGEIIPDAPDQADLSGGGKIVFTRSVTNNDYNFRDVSYSGSERRGTLRAMRIKDDVYAVQARYDDESQYQILFYSIDAEHIRMTDVVADTDLKVFASLYGVEYRGDEFNKSFLGKPEKILTMLKGMSAVEFIEP